MDYFDDTLKYFDEVYEDFNRQIEQISKDLDDIVLNLKTFDSSSREFLQIALNIKESSSEDFFHSLADLVRTIKSINVDLNKFFDDLKLSLERK